MMAPPEYYVFTGRESGIPDHVTHVLIDKGLNFVRAWAFESHPNIQELICHDGIEIIEQYAFNHCPSLRRVIMPGVKEVEHRAFHGCRSLTYIECGKLEIIGAWAFGACESLSVVDLPSIKIAGIYALHACKNLTNVKFGKDLESIRAGVFLKCTSLERIALPLKDYIIDDADIFQCCVKLKNVDLIGGVHETVAALQMEEWKNDINEEIDSFNQNFASARAGNDYNAGGKAREIDTWIRSILPKIVRYKAEHRRYLNEAAATLQPALPNDILHKNILPFLELPSDTSFEED